ncbi:hypothetical protein E4U50_001187 [Claviceps purpurea]|nr:hypothetical protein E4U50_001187 [Claviceps purpurea]
MAARMDGLWRPEIETVIIRPLACSSILSCGLLRPFTPLQQSIRSVSFAARLVECPSLACGNDPSSWRHVFGDSLLSEAASRHQDFQPLLEPRPLTDGNWSALVQKKSLNEGKHC